jgi:hypothetical protein
LPAVKGRKMPSLLTEPDFKQLLAIPVGTTANGFIKIEDTEKRVFDGTFKRTISWQEGDRFFSHKSMITGTHGQKENPVFDTSCIKEVFPVEVKTVYFLTEEEIYLRNFYESNAITLRAS